MIPLRNSICTTSGNALLQEDRLANMSWLPQLEEAATEGSQLAGLPDAAQHQQSIAAEQNTDAHGACDGHPASEERFWCPVASCHHHSSDGFKGFLRWESVQSHIKKHHDRHKDALIAEAAAASTALLCWCHHIGCPKHVDSDSGFGGYWKHTSLRRHLLTCKHAEVGAHPPNTDPAIAAFPCMLS